MCQAMKSCQALSAADVNHAARPQASASLAGALFINYSQERLQQFEDIKFQGLQGANARKIVLFVGIMAAHALGEGSGVGVSFCGTRGWAQVCPACSLLGQSPGKYLHADTHQLMCELVLSHFLRS